jgi:hypothetical protein
MDPSPIVKRAVLHNISALCIFLGRQKTNDVILSHMITYLNDRDWLLRHAFFESIVDVAACAGGRSLEEYILPLMVQALSGEPSHCTPPCADRRRRRGERRRARLVCAHQSLRTGPFPKDAHMGAHERDPVLLLPPQRVDTTGCVVSCPSVVVTHARDQGRLRSSPLQRNISRRATCGVSSTPPCAIYCVATSRR